MRQAVRRARRNQSARSAVRTFVKNAGAAVVDGGDAAAEIVRQAVRALDKAAQKGIIHRNAAARRKSRLMTRLHQLSLAEPAPEAPAKATAAKKPIAKASTARTATAAKKPWRASPRRRSPPRLRSRTPRGKAPNPGPVL